MIDYGGARWRHPDAIFETLQSEWPHILRVFPHVTFMEFPAGDVLPAEMTAVYCNRVLGQCGWNRIEHILEDDRDYIGRQMIDFPWVYLFSTFGCTIGMFRKPSHAKMMDIYFQMTVHHLTEKVG